MKLLTNRLGRLGATAATVGILLFGGAAVAQAAEIIVYSDAYYSGQSRRLTSDEPNLSTISMNDRISSARVVSGTWTVCTDVNYRGRCETLTGDVSNFATAGLNDRISSISLDRGRGSGGRGDRDAGITLYNHTDFGGDSVYVDNDQSRLGGSLNFNDRATSIRVHGGTWEVCSGNDYSGRCVRISDDVRDLRSLRLHNDVSSVRLVRGGSGGWGDGSWRDRRPGRGNQVILFEHTNYNGQSVGFHEDIPDLTRYGFNDRASSVQTPAGSWELCEHTNYRGQCWTIHTNEANLIPLGANDRISSMRRVDNTPGGGGGRRDGITLFEHTSYGGRQVNIDSDTPSLIGLNFNDVMSSLRVHDDTWELCEHVNYQGRCWRVSSDDANVVPDGYNDRISSVRRARGGGGGGGGRSEITVYEHTNYGGRSRTFSGSVDNLVGLGWNDEISSFRVRGTWEVCEHTNYGGRCQRFTSDEDNLVSIGWNDRISSIREIRR